MAKQIIWSLRAQNDRKQILIYWTKRNRSNSYSKKLNQIFESSVRIISRFPEIGKLTDIENARVKVVKDYLVIYEETESSVNILTIWDTRQKPKKLKEILK